jgi:hypothetical protein
MSRGLTLPHSPTWLNLGFRSHSETFAVHQDPIAVEDHQVEAGHLDHPRESTADARIGDEPCAVRRESGAFDTAVKPRGSAW